MREIERKTHTQYGKDEEERMGEERSGQREGKEKVKSGQKKTGGKREKERERR